MAKRSDHYHWNNSPVLKDIIIEKCVGGKQNAILFAPEDAASQEKIATLQETLIRDYGVYSYAQTVEGKPALIAKNIGDSEHFLEILESKALGMIAGTPTVEEVKDPDAKKPTFGDRFDEFRHQHGLRVFAALGMAGHITSAVFLGLPKEITHRFGFEGEGNPDNLRNAITNMVNCSLYLWKGNGDRGLQTDPVLKKLHAVFAENGIDLEKTSLEDAVKHYEENKPLAKKLDDLVSDNIMWFTEGLGAYNNILSGMAGVKDQDYGKLTLSASAFVGSLYAMLVKEIPMKDQPQEKLDSPLGKLQAMAQASPLLVNTLSNIVGTVALPMDSIKRRNLITDQPLTYTETEGGVVRTVETSYKAKAAADLAKTTAKLDETYALDGSELRNNPKADLKGTNKLRDTLLDQDAAQANTVALGNKSNIVWQAHGAMSTFYILANIVSIFCSKNGAVDKDPFMKYEELLSRTAQMLREEVPAGEDREKAIMLAGTGLAAMHQDVRGINGQEISDHIRTLVNEFEHNPFVAKATPHQSQSQGQEEPHEEFARIKKGLTIPLPANTINAASGIDHLLLEQPPLSLAIH